MICNYCEHSPVKQHINYNIENVKERFIPTYTHSHIFSGNNNHDPHIRCTPTFHSTALNVDGYQILTNQHIKNKLKGNSFDGRSTYQNQSRQKRQRDLNPGQNCFIINKNESLWYDTGKRQLFESLKCCPDYSKQRKLADLSSNQVFGGVVMEPLKCTLEEKSLKQTKIEPKEEIKAEEFNGTKETKNYENASIDPIIKQAIQHEIPIQAIQRPVTAEGTKKKQNSNQYKISNDITFGKKEQKVGKKINKTVVIQRPTFTVVRKRRGQ